MSPAVGKSLEVNSHDGNTSLDAVATRVRRIKMAQRSYDIGEPVPDDPTWLSSGDRYFETPSGEVVYVSGRQLGRVYVLYTERDAFEHDQQYSPYSLVQDASTLLQRMEADGGWKLIPKIHQIGEWDCPECEDGDMDVSVGDCSCGYHAPLSELVNSGTAIKVY